jgi:AbrB family looped-hinge helix DNA binding protein
MGDVIHTKLGEGRRVAIPAELCHRFGLEPGDPVVLESTEAGITVRPLEGVPIATEKKTTIFTEAFVQYAVAAAFLSTREMNRRLGLIARHEASRGALHGRVHASVGTVESGSGRRPGLLRDGVGQLGAKEAQNERSCYEVPSERSSLTH